MPSPRVITLGCFLIATMASIQFRDVLRSKLDSLVCKALFSEAHLGEHGGCAVLESSHHHKTNSWKLYNSVSIRARLLRTGLVT